MSTILAFDTAGPYCAAAVCIDGRTEGRRTDAMSKGQAERLMPLLQEVLEAADVTYSALDAIGVGIGPGNFTGVRISVSAARGLALGLGIPAIGVSGFQAVRRLAGADDGRTLTLLPAPRGGALWELADDGQGDRVGLARGSDLSSLAGTDLPGVLRWPGGAPFSAEGDLEIPGGSDFAHVPEVPVRIAPVIAEIAAERLASGEEIPRPAPLYVRPADAAPPSDPPPVILP